MEQAQQTLLNSIKIQAEAFLLDAAEFYPFGTRIKSDGEVVPLAAYVEDRNDMPSSVAVLDLLRNSLQQRIDYLVAAIAVDALVTKEGQKYDALEIRLFEAGKQTDVIRYAYTINVDNVDFGAI